MDQHSNSISRFYRNIILVWALAIIGLYFGNIINFHQHHIWGKQLMPVATTNNRPKEKMISLTSQGPSDFHKTGELSVFIPDVNPGNNLACLCPETSVHFPYLTPSCQASHITGNLLRAPPVA